MIRRLITAIPFLMYVSTLYAIPVSYDENVNGDLSAPTSGIDFTPFPSIGVFDTGVNTVTGFTFIDPITNRYNFDSFSFVLPVGLQITSITFQGSFIGAAGASMNWSLLQSTTPIVNNASTVLESFAPAPLTNTIVSMHAASSPLAAGNYGISLVAAGVTLRTDQFRADYQWSFHVASVPEPPIVALLSIGFIGLCAARKLKKH